MTKRYKHILIFTMSVILTSSFISCKRISWKDYELAVYDGDWLWEQVTKKAGWDNRYDHESVVFNEHIWVIGGYNPGNSGDSYYEDIWKSADGENWTMVDDNADFKGRRGHSLVAFNNTLFLIGGFSVDEETGIRTYRNDVWQSTDGEVWTEIKSNIDVAEDDSLNWVPRMHHKCLVANHGGVDYIYLIGGQSMREGVEGRYAMTYFNDVWRSTDGINWQKLFNTNYGIRSEHAATVNANGRLFIQGGIHGTIFESENNSSHPIADYQFLYYSDNGVDWEKDYNIDIVEDGYMWRASHEMVYYKNKIWTLPGKTNSNNHYHFATEQYYPTWTYDTEFGLDSKGTAIDARHGYSAVVFKEHIYVLGGNTNRKGQENDVWKASLK